MKLGANIFGQECKFGFSTDLTSWKWNFSDYLNIAFSIFINGMKKLLLFPHCSLKIPQTNNIYWYANLLAWCYFMYLGAHIFGQES